MTSAMNYGYSFSSWSHKLGVLPLANMGRIWAFNSQAPLEEHDEQFNMALGLHNMRLKERRENMSQRVP